MAEPPNVVYDIFNYSSILTENNITWFNSTPGLLLQQYCELLLNLSFGLGNVTCLREAPILDNKAKLRTIVLATMAVFSLIGNSLTIFSISRDKGRQKSTMYGLIHHLSIADLFVTCACIIVESVWTYTVQWLAGNLMCKFIKYMQMFSLYSSTFIMVLIGIDRFRAIKYPMIRNSSSNWFSYGVSLAWLLSGILSIPQLIIFSVQRGPFVVEFKQCVTHGFYTKPWQEQLYATLTLVFMFVLPLLIILTTYTLTFITLHKSEEVLRDDAGVLGRPYPDCSRKKKLRKAKLNALTISVVIVLAFIVCWTPYNTMMIIFMFMDPDEHLSKELHSAIFFFGMSNSLVNPIIYGAFHLCRYTNRKSSLNLIIIQRSRCNLQYRASMKSTVSKCSATLQALHEEDHSSVINLWENGVRYSFRRHDTPRAIQTSPQLGSTSDTEGNESENIGKMRYSSPHYEECTRSRRCDQNFLSPSWKNSSPKCNHLDQEENCYDFPSHPLIPSKSYERNFAHSEGAMFNTEV